MKRLIALCLAPLFVACVATDLSPGPTDPGHPLAPAGRAAESPATLGAGFDPFASRAGETAHADHAHASHDHAASAPQPEHPATVYTCPMHPEVRASEPGRCPKCGMKLEPVEGGK